MALFVALTTNVSDIFQKVSIQASMNLVYRGHALALHTEKLNKSNFSDIYV